MLFETTPRYEYGPDDVWMADQGYYKTLVCPYCQKPILRNTLRKKTERLEFAPKHPPQLLIHTKWRHTLCSQEIVFCGEIYMNTDWDVWAMKITKEEYCKIKGIQEERMKFKVLINRHTGRVVEVYTESPALFTPDDSFFMVEAENVEIAKHLALVMFHQDTAEALKKNIQIVARIERNTKIESRPGGTLSITYDRYGYVEEISISQNAARTLMHSLVNFFAAESVGETCSSPI